MVDEVDSVLIDDARTPLIISGPALKGEDQMFQELKPRIETIGIRSKKQCSNSCSMLKIN